MSDTSKTYKELASPHFGEVFSLIENVCKKQNVPVYLIGAHAKIILMLKEGIRPARGTKDIDFAIMIPDISSYDNFLSELEKYGFRRVQEPYRVIYGKTNTVVDILPFGQIEEEGTIKFTDRKTELSVLGMEEVLDSAIQIEHEGFDVSVPPLVGLMILKLISWSEKPDRHRDLDDSYEIIKDYFEISQENFYQNYLEMVDELNAENFTLEAGSFMVGVEMGLLMKENSILRNTILKIVNNELNESPGSISIYFLQKKYFNDHNLVKRVFTLIDQGIFRS
ncbi:MAG: hypothetical protein RQ761_12240 [Bacteroidales bacterium]|nr:hypothetical protein [Bacteroidales bacterium]